MYELVLERSPNYRSNAADKVKQEILHGLGRIHFDLYNLFSPYACLTHNELCVFVRGSVCPSKDIV